MSNCRQFFTYLLGHGIYHHPNHSCSLTPFPGTVATEFKVSQNCNDFETLNGNGRKPNS